MQSSRTQRDHAIAQLGIVHGLPFVVSSAVPPLCLPDCRLRNWRCSSRKRGFGHFGLELAEKLIFVGTTASLPKRSMSALAIMRESTSIPDDIGV